MPFQLSEFKPEYCEIATKVLANGESLAAICDELDIGLQKAQRDWERIGREGVVGNIDKFAASTWIFTMKNRFRDDYKEEKAEPTLNESLVEKLIDKLIE